MIGCQIFAARVWMVGGLPPELFDRVIQYLDLSSIVHLSCANKECYQFMSRNVIWKQLLERTNFDIPTIQHESSRSGLDAIERIDKVDYRQIFRDTYVMAQGWEKGLHSKVVLHNFKEILISIKKHQGNIYCGSISGRLHVIGEQNQSIHAHTDALSCLALNDDYLFTGSWNRTLKMSRAFQILYSFQFESEIISMLLDSSELYVGLNNGHVYHIAFEKKESRLLYAGSGIVTAILRYRSYLVFSVSNYILFWDMKSHQIKFQVCYPYDSFSGIVIIQDKLYAASNDGKVQTWAIPDLLEQGGDVPPLSSILAHPSSGIRVLLAIGNYIATAAYDGSIGILKFEKDLELKYKLLAHRGDVNGLAYDNGTLYSIGDDGKVLAWRVADRESMKPQNKKNVERKLARDHGGYTWADAAEWVLSQSKEPLSCTQILEVMMEKNAYPELHKKPTPSNTLNMTLHSWCKQSRPRFTCTTTIPHRFSIHPNSKFVPTPPPHLHKQ
jgi:WD40 repeat protein